MATTKESHLESLPVSPELLESATRWYDISWWGLIVFGSAAALAAIGTVIFTLLQFWSEGVLDRHTNWRTGTLEKETAEAKRDLGRSQQRIAELAKEAEALKAQAEADRLARIKIEEKLAPRSFTGDQANAIMKAVEPFAPQPFEFVTYQDDAEVQGFARYLAGILVTAGWKGVKPTNFLAFQLEFGIRIEFTPDKQTEFGPAANALANALNNAGFAASVGSRGYDTNETLRIRIGKKP